MNTIYAAASRSLSLFGFYQTDAPTVYEAEESRDESGQQVKESESNVEQEFGDNVVERKGEVGAGNETDPKERESDPDQKENESRDANMEHVYGVFRNSKSSQLNRGEEMEFNHLLSPGRYKLKIENLENFIPFLGLYIQVLPTDQNGVILPSGKIIFEEEKDQLFVLNSQVYEIHFSVGVSRGSSDGLQNCSGLMFFKLANKSWFRGCRINVILLSSKWESFRTLGDDSQFGGNSVIYGSTNLLSSLLFNYSGHSTDSLSTSPTSTPSLITNETAPPDDLKEQLENKENQQEAKKEHKFRRTRCQSFITSEESRALYTDSEGNEHELVLINEDSSTPSLPQPPPFPTPNNEASSTIPDALSFTGEPQTSPQTNQTSVPSLSSITQSQVAFILPLPPTFKLIEGEKQILTVPFLISRQQKSNHIIGDLHLTNYRCLFTPVGAESQESCWKFPIGAVHLIEWKDDKPYFEMRLVGRDLNTIELRTSPLFTTKKTKSFYPNWDQYLNGFQGGFNAFWIFFQTMFESLIYPQRLDDLFAFPYANLCQQKSSRGGELKERVTQGAMNGWEIYDPTAEYQRIGISGNRWRISTVNSDYKICNSYPSSFVVPSVITDEELRVIAEYRSRGRIPVVVWKNPPQIGAELSQEADSNTQPVLARCAQPLTGVRNSRSIADEHLLNELRIGCGSSSSFEPTEVDVNQNSTIEVQESNLSAFSPIAIPTPVLNPTPTPAPTSTDASETNHSQGLGESLSSNGLDPTLASSDSSPKLYIIDARPLLNAMTNCLLGKGYEDVKNYHNAIIQFQDIPNIHQLNNACIQLHNKLVDNFLDATHDSSITSTVTRNLAGLAGSLMGSSFVSDTRLSDWQWYISKILTSSLAISHHLEYEHCSVLVHCSDGWDRTSQLVSLTEIILDPYYRTFKGFAVLIEKEWVSFGHKFRTRNGILMRSKPDWASWVKTSESSPIFLQWLDCVWQILQQVPKAFEFNERFLLFLAKHIYSSKYGNFLHDTEEQRRNDGVRERTISIWSVYNNGEKMKKFQNVQYQQEIGKLLPCSSISLLTEPQQIRVWESFHMAKRFHTISKQ